MCLAFSRMELSETMAARDGCNNLIQRKLALTKIMLPTTLGIQSGINGQRRLKMDDFRAWFAGVCAPYSIGGTAVEPSE